MKKLISALLALAMILSLMPMAVFATEDEGTQARNPVVELYVGTVNALETPQGDGWSFDAESGVLTLNNCTLTESMLHVETDEYGSYRYDAMIYVKGDLTIELIGNNSVERVIEEAPTDYTNYYAICNSIYCPSDWEMPGSLTFVGDGNLTVGVAVSRDYLSEDGLSTNEAWEYLEFSSGIASWNYTDLSGLYGGGWMDIYGGVYGIEAPYIACAFANYPTFGDNCIVTAYRDVDGTIENENGYNWNNNDAWRMYVTTAGAHLSNAGKLTINGDTNASGDGWSWSENVLSLAAGTAVQTVTINKNTSSATLVLSSNLTLDATLGMYGAPAITAACDLTIDLNGHTLTIPATDASDAIKTEPGSLTILNGQLDIPVQPYDPEYAEEMGEDYVLGSSTVNVSGGGLTLRDVTLNTSHVVLRSSAVELWPDGASESIYYDCDPLTVEDSTVTCCELYSESDVSILRSDVTVNGEYSAICGNTVNMQDSTVSAAVSDPDWGVVLSGTIVMDNCNVTLSGAYITYADSADAVVISNMEITAPAGCRFGEGEDTRGSSFYTFWNSDGTLVNQLTATATGGGDAHEHSYENGICSCGAKQTFTITWANWDGTVLETDTVEYGTVPTYDGAAPTRPNVGYDFNFYGWALSASGAETTIGAATQDRTYYAKYTSSVHYHDIIFMDEDMVTELGRYETYYDKLIADSWLTTASGITVPPCYTAWWHYEDGSMPEESFRMPDHDVVLYIMWEGPGHVYDGVITTEPTCTQEGVMTYTCIGCGDSYTDSLWPKGHSYAGVVTEPTCTEGGYTTYTCSDCGDSYVGDQVAAHGHDYCNFVTTEPTCTTDGYTTYSCMFCGDSYVTDIVEGGHKFGVIYITNATCTEYGSSSGTCIVCGELVTDDAYEAPLGHEYTAQVTTEPTCTAAGVMTYTCTRCADSYTEEIAALAHDFSTGAQCTTCGTDAEASVTIGGIVTYYATAYEASTAVQYCTEEDNALIILLKDIVLEKSFDRYISLKNCVCTLDLNGKTVYGNSKNYEPIRVRFDSDVTIVDSVGTGKVTGGANTFGVVYSTLTVNGGTFIGTQYGASSSGDSTVIINGGTFEGKYGGCFYDCDVIINGGTFTGTEYGLYVRKTGGDTSTTTINGGTISGTVCDIYVYSAESTVTLSVGEDGIGATFPGGISVDGTDLAKRPLNALLGEGMTYWCNGSAISFNDDVYEFSGGDVSVRKICQHSYENGYCTECGQKDPNYVEVVVPTLTLKYPTLAFEDEILYNAYFTVSDATSIVEMGMITFDSRLADGTIADAVEVIPGYYTVGSNYIVSSNGIPAKNLGDALYFKVYAKLTDGSYAYSDVAGYNAVAYANTILNNASSSAKAKALVVAMLNYGAAAQVQFNYNTDNLMNASLTAEQLALVDAYDESMVDAVVKADSSKVGLFVHNGGYTRVFPTVSFEGAFSINYYFATKYTPDTAPTFYIWDAETYNSVEVLTAENAVGTIDMVLDGDQWVGTVAGIAAKEIDQTYYTAGVYYVGDTAYYSPVVSYSLGNYCETLAASDNAFGAATAVYGYYAKAYFN